MRKSVLYKLTASIVWVSAIAISTSSVSAQRRSQQYEKTRYEERNKSTRLKDADRKEKYNKSRYSDNSDRKKNNTSNKKSTKYYKERNIKGYSNHQKNGNYKHGDWNRNNRLYSKKSYHSSGDRYRSYNYPKMVHTNQRYRNFYNNHGNNCYRHDRYGNVVLRFAVAPVVIRHSYGDYYFSDGDYYRFYPEVGYVVVDAPNSLYFSYVPDNCHRVLHHGNEYYTNGEIYFVKHRNGFRLENAPTGIHLSLRF
ncbi:hypothetical protein QUH73_13045 [Labilibaculum sp. K2S]|uniref:DUF6515 family protein n=1 Tax=Labilibaculum sp. K2S TaxID=3056386 RepID=UPI0025A44F43|nr:DUF6515 family protein [Labilibaculum sp. K2S]MDM8160747.1 hypothetical protein [Labilibaculum sp. K2S]